MVFVPEDFSIYPKESGIYLMKGEGGTVLYVGKAKNLRVRLRSYFSLQDTRAMVPILLSQIKSIETLITPSEKEALLLENTLIKKHKPKYNVLLKDDKTFIGIAINQKHPWPTITLLRCHGKPPSGLLYFGPYTNAVAARATVDLIHRLFPLRECSDRELLNRSRPCILYGMKRCCAPCVNKCSSEEYHGYLKSALDFLKGKDREIIKDLKEKMKTASDDEEFEKAGIYLETIRQIEEVTQTNSITCSGIQESCDALAIYREGGEVVIMQLIIRHGKLCGSQHYSFSNVLEEDDAIFSSFLLQHYIQRDGRPQVILLPQIVQEQALLEELLEMRFAQPQKGTKKELLDLAIENAKASFLQVKDRSEMREKLLLDLQERCSLTRYPARIECVDISHTGGKEPVGCVVAFTNGAKDKERMRLYKIKEAKNGDDYGAMREVLQRRLARGKEENDLPDLILVDGGKGQLNIALDVVRELDISTIDLVGIAKEGARHDRGMTLERLFLPGKDQPLHLPATSPLLFLLQQIRDESHRVAITFHRKQRASKTIRSWLDNIPGIGPKKRQELLRHFGSALAVKAASENELMAVKGISAKDAQNLLKKARP